MSSPWPSFVASTRSSGGPRSTRATSTARSLAPTISLSRPVRSRRRAAAGRRSSTGAAARSCFIPRCCDRTGMVMLANYPERTRLGGLSSRRTTVSEQYPRFRSILDQFAGYKPGKAPTPAGGRTYKLSSNESPYDPLPSVRAVLADAASHINRYPDSGAAELTEAIASRFAVPTEHVAVGCGSVGVAQQLLEAVGEPGAEVIYAWRSFEAYPYLADLAGATSVRVPLRDFRHDLPAMAAAMTDRTRLIFVCTPNNPTGPAVQRDELADFLDRVPPDCLVVLDEAYVQYVRDPQAPRPPPVLRAPECGSAAYLLQG